MLFFIPHDQHQDPPLSLLWEVGLSLCTHSQPLCFSQPLQGASSSSGRLAFYPALALSLCFFTHVRSLRVWFLAPLSFSEAGSGLHSQFCSQCHIMALYGPNFVNLV
jgi:hypothetical protein